MKVLFVIDTLQGAGAEKSLVEIAKNFTEFSPVFVHIYPGNMLAHELRNSKIQVYSLNIEKNWGFKEAVKKLAVIYKKEKPDIVHSTLFRADMVARKMKSIFPDIPLVGSFVNNSYTPLRYKNQSFFMKIKLWLTYQMDLKSAKKVDFFISNSKTIKYSEGNSLLIPMDKIVVVYRGRDPRQFVGLDNLELNKLTKSLNLENKNVLINVSRLIERKGQLDILKAMPDVLKKFPNTILLIVGNGNYEEVLKKEILALNIEKNVQLLGRRNDIPELLAISDIFIYPSYAEGLPGALIEAMMSGKIIIASNIGENLECVNEDSALIFEKGNVQGLTHNICNAIENQKKLVDFGKMAKLQALEKFEIQSIAKRYENIYREII